MQGCTGKTPLTLWHRQAGSWGCLWKQSSICSYLKATQTSWRHHFQVGLQSLYVQQVAIVSCNDSGTRSILKRSGPATNLANATSQEGAYVRVMYQFHGHSLWCNCSLSSWRGTPLLDRPLFRVTYCPSLPARFAPPSSRNPDHIWLRAKPLQL